MNPQQSLKNQLLAIIEPLQAQKQGSPLTNLRLDPKAIAIQTIAFILV